MSRILVTSDWHCGHLRGITPPDWQWENKSETAWRKKVCAYQKWAWAELMSYVDEFRPYTHHINLGDCVDGKGQLSGGREHLTVDREEQQKMAIATFKAIRVNKKKTYMVRGTGYHVGISEEWENGIATAVKAEIDDHMYIEINGVVISAKHFVGGCQSPVSKATSIVKEQLTNDQWQREYKEHPRASIFLRGHVHRTIAVDEPSTLSMIVPGLQWWTGFGAKKCSMPVHFGIVAIDIDKKGNWSWQRRTANLGQQVRCIKG